MRVGGWGVFYSVSFQSLSTEPEYLFNVKVVVYLVRRRGQDASLDGCLRTKCKHIDSIGKFSKIRFLFFLYRVSIRL